MMRPAGFICRGRISFGFSPPDDWYFAARLRDGWANERHRLTAVVREIPLTDLHIGIVLATFDCERLAQPIAWRHIGSRAFDGHVDIWIGTNI